MLPAQMPTAAPEVVALASALADVLIASKTTGSSALGDAEAALPDLLAAAGSLVNIGADIKLAHNQAYIIWAIAQALEPA